MNNYYEIAALYFKRFEGAQFFPKWSDRISIFLLISLAIFGFYLYWFFIATSVPFIEMWPLYASELLLFACAFRVVKYRSRALIASLPVQDDIDEDQRVNYAKRNALIELTGRPASEFLVLLDEIKKLQVLEQQHRSRLDPDFLKSFLYFINLPVWTRTASLLLAGASIFFGKPGKIADLNVSDFFNHPQTLSTLWSLLVLLFSAFVVGFVIYLVTQQLLEFGALIVSTKWPSKTGNTTMLNCVMRDLIRYYLPEPKQTPTTETQANTQVTTTTPASNNKPASLGVALAALSLKVLYRAWTNSRPAHKR